jgi:hypothetical protein
MGMGLLFWILMLLWLVFGLYWNWPAGGGAPAAYGPIGGNLLLFILLLLLGWHEFGSPIHG